MLATTSMTRKLRELLEYRKKHPQASRLEVAKALGVSEWAVRDRSIRLRTLGVTLPPWPRKQPVAVGSIRRRHSITVTITMPVDLFTSLHNLAVQKNTSFAAQAILCMDWGLEAEKEHPQ